MNNLHNVNHDTLMVLTAARLGGLTEFQLFEHTYKKYIKAEDSLAKIEKSFVAYLFHEDIPTWVSLYSRDILDAHDISINQIQAEHHSPIEFANVTTATKRESRSDYLSLIR